MFKFWKTAKASEKNTTLLTFRRMLNAKDLEQIEKNLSDRRTVALQVATKLGISELALLAKVATQLKMSVVEKPLPFNIELLKGHLTLSELRKCGAVLVGFEQNISGIVCVDPELIVSLKAKLGNPKVYLSTWEAIAKALDESETLFKLRREAGTSAQEKRGPLAERVLSLIVAEVDKHGCLECVIHLEAAEPYYSFTLDNNRVGAGALSLSLREELKVFCSEKSKSSVKFNSKNAAVEIISRDESNSFLLKWGSKAQRETKSEKVVFLKSERASRGIQGVPTQVKKLDISVTNNTLPKPIVLVIDDNPTFVKVLERFFSKQDVVVEPAKNGIVAKERLQASPTISLVICDQHMPGMLGSELLSFVRHDSKFNEIPFVILTSDSDIEMEVHLINSGADAFISKSQDPRVLCAYVKRLLDKLSSNRRAA